MKLFRSMRSRRSMLIFLLTVCIAFYASAQSNIYYYDGNYKIQGNEQSIDSPQLNYLIDLSARHDSGTWSREFSVPGIPGYVYATGSDGTNLYIGGNFQAAGGIVANSIVRWNGQAWTSIGQGEENGITRLTEFDVPSVEAIAFIDGKLFVGGQFRKAGSLEVNGIAYWENGSWHRLGNEGFDGVRRKLFDGNDTIIMSGFVYSMFGHNHKLYIGGYFDLAGEIGSRGVAAWDITTGTWESLDGGLGGTTPTEPVYAYSFAARGDTVFTGGKFNSAGGVPAINFAIWNGSQWSSAGNAEGYIYDLKLDEAGNLYAAGFFNPNEATGACGLGKWDGSDWISIQGPAGYNSSVTSIEILDDEIYAGGSFVSPVELPAALAKFDGTGWELFPGLGYASNEFFLGNVFDLQLINNKLFVVGAFTKADPIFPINVVEWDHLNSSWKKLDDGNPNQGIHDGMILSMERSGNSIYAGGNFSVAGGTYARNIASWNGNNWQALGTGFENGIGGTVYEILTDGEMLFAGGYFGSAGSSEAYHVAMWDETSWSPLGIGVGGVPGAHVRALAKVDNYIYVGGYFSVVGDAVNYALPANSIARFNLSTNLWEALGNGIVDSLGGPARVNDLKAFEGQIFIGGDFKFAGDKLSQNFAVWNGTDFAGLGDAESIGVQGKVHAIEVIGDEIIIGGFLQLIPDGIEYGILKWNGEQWIAFDKLLSAESGEVFVYDIEPFNEGFIAGGSFRYAGDTQVNNLAYFDGSDWNELGGGALPGVIRIAALDNNIYLSGPEIIHTGGEPNIGLAMYNYDHTTGIPAPDQSLWNFSLKNYPNPFIRNTTLTYFVPGPGMVKISLYDAFGREIKNIQQDQGQAGKYNLELDGSGMEPGIYFYRVTHGAYTETGKMIRVP
jgi:hypothetical protein